MKGRVGQMLGLKKGTLAAVLAAVLLFGLLPAETALAASLDADNQTAASDPSHYRPGDTIHYELSVRNTNPSPAILTVEDTLPDGTVVPLETDSTFAPGEVRTYGTEYVANAGDAGERPIGKVHVNTLRVTGTEVPASGAPDEIEVIVTKTTLFIDPGLAVSKTVDFDGDGVYRDSETSEPGEASWKIIVTNTGDAPLDDVRVTDTNGKVFGPYSLEPGENMTETYTTSVTEDTVNTATASGRDRAGRPVGPVADSAEALVLGPPDMAIAKSADHQTALAGDLVTYTITYRVIGAGTANAYTIVDDYDERLVDIVDAGGAEVVDGTLVWEFSDPMTESDGPRTLTYSVRIKPDVEAGTQVDNVVVVDFPDDTNPENNRASWRVNVTEPFLPYSGEPFLPYTGGSALALAAFALLALALGLTGRLWGGGAQLEYRPHLSRLGVPLALACLLLLTSTHEAGAAGIALGKDATPDSPQTYRVGDVVDYVVDVKNTNPNPATLQVTDTLPDGTVVVLDDGAQFAAGEERTYKLSYEIRAEDIVDLESGETTLRVVRNEVRVEGFEQTDVADYIFGRMTESSIVIEPALSIRKTVDFDGDGEYNRHETYRAGYPAAWRVVVTNTGDVPLSDIAVSDTNTNDFGAVFSLEPGESETFEYDTYPRCDTTNTATAQGIASDGRPVGPVMDQASVTTVESAIGIDKTVDFDGDGEFSSAETGVAGTDAVWKLVLTNVGDTSLIGARMTDTNGRSYGPYMLEPGASVVETYTTIVSEDTTNVATAEATDTFGLPVGPVTDTATARVIHPAIDVEKLVDFDCDGEYSREETGPAGASASWKIVTTNPGDTPLDNVVVTDTNGMRFDYGTLAAGETRTEVYDSTVEEDTRNTATVVGQDPTGRSWTESSSATARVCYPSISVEKTVDADRDGEFHDEETVVCTPESHGDDTCAAAADPDSAIAEALPREMRDLRAACIEEKPTCDDCECRPFEVEWKIVVTNDGDCELTGVTVEDSNGSSLGPVSLAPGEAKTYTYATHVDADTTNVAEATGFDRCGGRHTDSDDASVKVICPDDASLRIKKYIDFNGDGRYDDDHEYGDKGSTASWKVVVTNTGQTSLSDVTVEDTNGYAFPTFDLGTGESRTFVYETHDVRTDTLNTATARAQDPYGRPVGPVQDSAEAKVRCAPGASRTMGYWKTHPTYTDHVFASHLGGHMDLGWKQLGSTREVLGVLWADTSRNSDGSPRSKLCMEKVKTSQQLVAAILNTGLENGRDVPSYGSTDLISAARAALMTDDVDLINALGGALDAYNRSGDNVDIDESHAGVYPASADPDAARALADVTVVDCGDCCPAVDQATSVPEQEAAVDSGAREATGTSEPVANADSVDHEPSTGGESLDVGEAPEPDPIDAGDSETVSGDPPGDPSAGEGMTPGDVEPDTGETESGPPSDAPVDAETSAADGDAAATATADS